MRQSVAMLAKDAPYGSMAEAFVDLLSGERRKLINFTSFESTAESKTIDVKILGQIEMGHKPGPVSLSFKGKGYYNDSTYREMMLEYTQTGIMPEFTIQVTNYDPASSARKQTIIHRGCLLDKVVLAKFEAGESVLEEEISGTFESFDMPQKFDTLPGMRA